MRRLIIVLMLACGALQAAPPAEPGFWDRFRAAVDENLGRPYVWGACGLKSYDCSGFVWRVMWDSGITMKRTTARKLYLSLPPAPKQNRWSLGNIVFFDNLKHCGIVNSPADFYHAAVSTGTTKSQFTPYWRAKISGVRRLAR